MSEDNRLFDAVIMKCGGIENVDMCLLNDKNRYITKDYLRKMINGYCPELNYEPHDIEIFQVAMTHESYVERDFSDIKVFKESFSNMKESDIDVVARNNVITFRTESYERIEFFGDAILRLIIVDYIFMRYNKMRQNELSDLRAHLENRKSFSCVTSCLGLNKYLLLSKNLEIGGYRDKHEKVLCDLFEAFIGALYYDILGITYSDIGEQYDQVYLERGRSYNACYTFVVKLIESQIIITDILEVDTNYKNMLYKIKIANKPKYKYEQMDVIKVNGKDRYTCVVYDTKNNNILGQGVGDSPSMAETMAAKNVLINLGVLFNNDDLNDNVEIFDENLIYNNK